MMCSSLRIIMENSVNEFAKLVNLAPRTNISEESELAIFNQLPDKGEPVCRWWIA